MKPEKISPMEDSEWIEVCALQDIPIRGSRIVKTPNGCVALFRTHENEVFALDDRCPHSGGPLSQGIVHGRSVTCPLHNWIISLETGEAINEDGRTETRLVKVEDGQVLTPLGSMGVLG